MSSSPLKQAVPRGHARQLWLTLSSAVPRLSTILDCGGGSGSLAVPLAALGAEVTVVDVSIDALGTLTRRAAEAEVSDRVSALQGEVESLAQLLDGRTFGLVLAHDVLHDVTDRAAALHQLANCVAPGGLLSIVVANPVAHVLSRALAGDLAGAQSILRQGSAAGYAVSDVVTDCAAEGLLVTSVDGLGVFTELVSGAALGGVDSDAELAALEEATHDIAPYRDIASKLHVLAERPRPAGSTG